jgi:hypothetical protein
MNKIDAYIAGAQTNLIRYCEDTVRRAILNRCITSPALAIGTSSTAAVKVTATTPYLSNGVFKSRTAVETAFTATTHDIPANASYVQERCYLLTFDAAGTGTLTAGDVATGAGLALLPELPATGTVFGYVRVAVAAGATPFDASTDALSAGHLTVTYVNLGNLIPSFDAAQ